MAEKVIPENLNGAEIRGVISKAVEDALRKQCTLRDIDSYSVFRAEIHIKVWLHDVGGIRQAEVTVKSDLGQVPAEEDPDQYLEEFDADIVLDENPSVNQVRQENDLPIPVLTTENGKPTIKHKKYARENKGKGK